MLIDVDIGVLKSSRFDEMCKTDYQLNYEDNGRD